MLGDNLQQKGAVRKFDEPFDLRNGNVVETLQLKTSSGQAIRELCKDGVHWDPHDRTS